MFRPGLKFKYLAAASLIAGGLLVSDAGLKPGPGPLPDLPEPPASLFEDLLPRYCAEPDLNIREASAIGLDDLQQKTPACIPLPDVGMKARPLPNAVYVPPQRTLSL